MKHLLLTILALSLFACGDATEPSEPESFGGSSSADALANAQASADTKGDDVRACGDDQCTYAMCGYDCSTPGEQCKRACAEADTRPATAVQLQVSGDTTANMDSTELGWNPELRLSDVLFFGCEVWDFSNQVKDGLEIHYEEVTKGSATPGGDESYANKANFYIAPFEGPGSYAASGYFRASNDSEKSYHTKDGCGVEVDVDADGTIHGLITCDSIAARKDAGGSIKVTGEFSCGVNATGLLFTDLTP